MTWIVWGLSVALVAVALWALRLRRDLRASKLEVAGLARAADVLRDEIAKSSSRLDRHVAVVAGARLGVLVLDPAGAVIEANPAAEEFVGARHGAALAETRIHQLVDAAMASGDKVEDEIEVRTPRPRIIHVTARAIHDTNWAVAYVDDITERRKVEAARTDFVANISHELKTPLGALALLAETLQDARDSASRQGLLGRIGEQAARMTQLVDDILDLSLVESAGMEPAIVDLGKVLAAAVSAEVDAAMASGVEVELEAANDDITVMGDERQLVSAVGNLLTNAVAYTAIAVPPRRVHARTYRKDEQAIIEIIDTGIGISAKHLPRIFERFYRVDSARSRETGGTGLGLAIVRHVALNHGGTVDVDSESGIGSTFRIVLPTGGVG